MPNRHPPFGHLALALGVLLLVAAPVAARPRADRPASLAVLATVPGGRHPEGLALDSVAGLLFVLDIGSYNPKDPPLGGSSLRVLSTADGRLLRTIPLSPLSSAFAYGGGYGGYLALDRPRHRLYVIEDGGEGTDAAAAPLTPPDVRVLDTRTGTTLARVPQRARTLAVDEATGRAFSAATILHPEGGPSYALLDAATGQPVASFGDRSIGALALDPAGGRVYVALGDRSPCPSAHPTCPDTTLLALASRSGRALWSGRFAGLGRLAAFDPPGRLLAFSGRDGSVRGTTLGILDVLDAATGASTARTTGVRPIGPAVASDPARAEAYVLSQSETETKGILVLDLRTGRPVRTLPRVGAHLPHYPSHFVGEGTLLVADPPHRRLLGVAESYQVYGPDAAPSTAYLEDAQTGSLLGQARIGLHPAALALDPATGHAFVANAQDGTITVLGLSPNGQAPPTAPPGTP